MFSFINPQEFFIVTNHGIRDTENPLEKEKYTRRISTVFFSPEKNTFTLTEQNDIHPGQELILGTVLGSCVSIFLYDTLTQNFSFSHMLREEDGRPMAEKALQILKKKHPNLKRYVAMIFGGGYTRVKEHGIKNLNFAKDWLNQKNICRLPSPTKQKGQLVFQGGKISLRKTFTTPPLFERNLNELNCEECISIDDLRVHQR